MNRTDVPSTELARWVVTALQEKKGNEIVQLDFRRMHNRIVDFFVICHATSITQAEALADSVEEVVKKQTGLKPKHTEGRQNREWILMDYFDVVVHIFLASARTFYRLEDLWSDADITRIED